MRKTADQATAMKRISLLWGHPLAIWDTGRTIRVPYFVFPLLRQRGLLIGNKAVLSPRILQDFADNDLHSITLQLFMVLGPDLSGPAQVECKCKTCNKRRSDTENIPLPGRNKYFDDRETQRIVNIAVKNRYV